VYSTLLLCSTGHANKKSEAPYETLTYANGPGFDTHKAGNLSNCSTGLWRLIPEEERQQIRWDAAIPTVVVVVVVVVVVITAKGARGHCTVQGGGGGS
jgi:hypothetical protein